MGALDRACREVVWGRGWSAGRVDVGGFLDLLADGHRSRAVVMRPVTAPGVRALTCSDAFSATQPAASPPWLCASKCSQLLRDLRPLPIWFSTEKAGNRVVGRCFAAVVGQVFCWS